MENQESSLPFFARLGLAFRLLGDGAAASKADKALRGETPAGKPLPSAAPAEQAKPAPAAPAPVSPAHVSAPAPAPVPAVLAPASPTPEQLQAQGLAFLGLLQREGRLVDFLREDVSSYGDADVGAAARVVHAGCRKVLEQYLTLEPAMPGGDGSSVTLPAGYDVQRVRLSGNVTGQPPFKGTLRHHGWVVTSVRLPAVSEAVDTKVVAPAEVEL